MCEIEVSEFMLTDLIKHGTVERWSLCTKPYTQARLRRALPSDLTGHKLDF